MMESSRLVYNAACPKFPPTLPLNYPHLIDTTRITLGWPCYKDLRLADAVVTILYAHDLDALDAFLNPRVPSFEFWIQHVDGESDAVILREDDIIKAGYRENTGPDNPREWVYWAEASIDLTGRWTSILGARGVADVQRERTTKLGTPYLQGFEDYEMLVEYDYSVEGENVGKWLGWRLLREECWRTGRGRVTWHAGRVVKRVESHYSRE